MMSDKELKEIALKEFEVVWEEYKSEMNASRFEKYNKKSWFGKLFDTPKYPQLDLPMLKSTAELFFSKGENKGMAYIGARNHHLLEDDEK